MTMTQPRLYPIGNPYFPELIEQRLAYVDKTAYIYRMTHSGAKYVFLSRPRRFGKSLLVSTLQAYFEGRRELFLGLAIDGMEQEWHSYPVLHFDLSMGSDFDRDSLNEFLIHQIERNERRFNIAGTSTRINIRLTGLIEQVFEQTGQQVVVMVDEYDAPLLGVVHEVDNLDTLRHVMVNFFKPLKGLNPYIRFCFLTGVTKFSQLSIFSAFNNIKNISMDADYAAICGITREELTTQLHEDIASLATRLGITPAQALNKLVEYYDGYHFAWPSPDIFNPYSLILAFSDGKIKPYWFETGTPTYLVEMMRHYGMTYLEEGGYICEADQFDQPTERMEDAIPLLYQSGYLTIKDCDESCGSYTLNVPNREVYLGLSRSLLVNYIKQPHLVKNMVSRMYFAIYRGQMDEALRDMQQVFSRLPYCDNADSEGSLQRLLALVFVLLGYKTLTEVRTSTGRIDVVMTTPSRLYLIELKLDQSAATAMRQIDLKDYPAFFAYTGLPRVKVGINFDKATRNLTDWTIEELP